MVHVACGRRTGSFTSSPSYPSPQFPGAPERSIEDLKARYYSVARQLLVGREGGPESVANNTLVRQAPAQRQLSASSAPPHRRSSAASA